MNVFSFDTGNNINDKRSKPPTLENKDTNFFSTSINIEPAATNDLFATVKTPTKSTTSNLSLDNLSELGTQVQDLKLSRLSTPGCVTDHNKIQNLDQTEKIEFDKVPDLTSKKIQVSKESIRYNVDSPCPFGCTNCGASFDSIHGLKRHLVSGHCRKKLGPLGPFSARSRESSASAGHGSARYATSMQDRREKCAVCDKMFQNKWLLRRHMKIHSGEKNFACETCGKRFREKSDLKTHMIKHSNIQRYQCEHCGKKFKWNASYRYHKFQSKSCGDKSSK